jgi:hypothetical protein
MPTMLRDSLAGCRASLGLGAEERWYVVRTQPHRELHAARQLENQAYRVFYRVSSKAGATPANSKPYWRRSSRATYS